MTNVDWVMLAAVGIPLAVIIYYMITDEETELGNQLPLLKLPQDGMRVGVDNGRHKVVTREPFARKGAIILLQEHNFEARKMKIVRKDGLIMELVAHDN